MTVLIKTRTMTPIPKNWKKTRTKMMIKNKKKFIIKWWLRRTTSRRILRFYSPLKLYDMEPELHWPLCRSTVNSKWQISNRGNRKRRAGRPKENRRERRKENRLRKKVNRISQNTRRARNIIKRRVRCRERGRIHATFSINLSFSCKNSHQNHMKRSWMMKLRMHTIMSKAIKKCLNKKVNPTK